MKYVKPWLVATAATALLATAGCVANDSESASIDVAITDDTCEISSVDFTSGTVAFSLTNTGDSINEFEIFADDQLRVVAEKENLANDGQPTELRVQLQPGTYYSACRPGMVGAPIGLVELTVTGDEIEIDADGQSAVDSYIAYTKAQVSELTSAVQEFTAAYLARDDDKARDLFPLTRQYYERIEPTATQFGTLDPAIDYRLPGAVAELDEFRGFHRIELDLWLDAGLSNYDGETYTDSSGTELAYLDLVDLSDRPLFEPLDDAGRKDYADKLTADVQSLYDLVYSPDFELSLSDISNGAVGLLDEVAAPDGKLPGEEDEFSHTDLSDFQANVEGAQVAYESVRDLALQNEDGGADLVDVLDKEFAAMMELLNTYGSIEDGYVGYDTVTQDQRNDLAAQLNALSEPLAQLTAIIAG